MAERDMFHDYRPEHLFVPRSHLPEGDLPDLAEETPNYLQGFAEKFYADCPEIVIGPEDLSWGQLVEEARKFFHYQLEDDFVIPPAHEPMPEFKLFRRYMDAIFKLSLKREGKRGWEAIKETFLGDRKAMIGFLSFRKNWVDGMIHTLKSKGLKFTAQSVGSVDLTSDYDLTFCGEDDIPATVEFNRYFREYWRVESGTLFDTNIYFRAWIMGRDSLEYPRNWPGVEKRENDDLMVTVPDYIGDIYSLVKIRRYTTKAEWDDLVKAIKRDVKVEGLEVDQIPRFKRLNLVEDIYQEQYVKPLRGRLEEEPGPKDPDVELRVANLMCEKLGAVTRQRERDIKGEHGGDFRWRQYQYNDGRYEKTERDTGLSWHGWITLTEEYSLLTSELLLFAPEAYNTQGAMWVVVVQGQSGVKQDNLTVDHYLQTFNEQVGDAFKELGHSLEAPGGYISASKYQIRMASSLGSIVEALDAELRQRKEAHRSLFGERVIGPDETDLSYLKAEETMASLYDDIVQELLKMRKRRPPYDKPDDVTLQQAIDNMEEDQKANILYLLKNEVEQVTSRNAIATYLVGKLVETPFFHELLHFESRVGDITAAEVGIGNRGEAWSLASLRRHLFWHCAYVNKLVRQFQSRGPLELYVKSFSNG